MILLALTLSMRYPTSDIMIVWCSRFTQYIILFVTCHSFTYITRRYYFHSFIILVFIYCNFMNMCMDITFKLYDVICLSLSNPKFCMILVISTTESAKQFVLPY